MATSQPASYIIEPFDQERHDRAAFSCGVEQVDNYFQKTANKLAKADNVRLYVMVDSEGSVIGFYALNAHAVQFSDLPAKFARTRPSHGNIPAAYISTIGRDTKFSGGGFGGDLLVDALRRIAVAADAIGNGEGFQDAGTLPAGELIGMRRQQPQMRLFNRGEQISATGFDIGVVDPSRQIEQAS